jgi:hypothetical protein
MTHATSSSSELPLDVSHETVERLKEMAMRSYNDAMTNGQSTVASWWDGYLRACDHILEADGQ